MIDRVCRISLHSLESIKQFADLGNQLLSGWRHPRCPFNQKVNGNIQQVGYIKRKINRGTSFTEFDSAEVVNANVQRG